MSKPFRAYDSPNEVTQVIPAFQAKGAPRVLPGSPTTDATDATQVIPAIPATVATMDTTQIIPAVPTHDTAHDSTQFVPAVPSREPRQRPADLPVAEPGEAARGYRGRHGYFLGITDGSPVRSAIRTLGEVMITAGLVLLLFAAYEVWGKAAIVNNHQHDLDSQLAQEWGDPVPVVVPTPGSVAPTHAPPPPPPPGGSIARLYIPKLDKYWVVVEGVGDKDLAYAPGHYPNTAQPGQVGNFAVAGHRSPAIFWDLDRMRAGDAIVLETRNTFYIYRVTETKIVAPTAVEVVAPVPGRPGETPTKAILTITTCNPKWDNYQRLIAHAQLQRVQARADGRPAELQE